MLCRRSSDWETGPLAFPFGRGVMLQIYVDRLDPLVAAIDSAHWPLHTPLREIWRRVGDRESGSLELVVQDPDGYLIMLAEEIGMRPAA